LLILWQVWSQKFGQGGTLIFKNDEAKVLAFLTLPSSLLQI
jgi:hypothetical protein